MDSPVFNLDVGFYIHPKATRSITVNGRDLVFFTLNSHNANVILQYPSRSTHSSGLVKNGSKGQLTLPTHISL